MEICDNFHTQIVHDEGSNNCPICNLISEHEHEKEMEELQDKVEELQDKVGELQDELDL